MKPYEGSAKYTISRLSASDENQSGFQVYKTMKTPPDFDLNCKRIIIVEDDRDFRESIVEYLELSGFNVIGVESALEFYQHISRQNYRLVILDIGLPDQNGLVLAEYIRNNTDMRIVMLTAQSSQQSKVSAYNFGADIYLVKPVDLSELSASLHSILGRLDVQSVTRQEQKIVEPESGHELKHWSLDRNNWVLYTPDRERIKLTSKEFDLIQVLASSPDRVVVREELLKALDYDNNEYGHRSIDVLIHRLRCKKNAGNYRIPIKTAHGSGHYFSAPINFV